MRVSFHVRSTKRRGYARLYGTVTPAETGGLLVALAWADGHGYALVAEDGSDLQGRGAFSWRVSSRGQTPASSGTRATSRYASSSLEVRSMPMRPAAQGNWGNADDWLPNTFRAAAAEDLLREAAGRRISTLARLGNLAEWAGRNDIAEKIETQLPSRLPVTFLGPRDRRAQWNKRWHVYNSLLSQR